MQGDVVIAAKWLGGSIVLASVILTGGLVWYTGRALPPTARPSSTMAPVAVAPLEPDADLVEFNAKPDAAILPALAVPPATTSAASSHAIVTPIPEERTSHVCPNPPTEDEVWSRIPKSKGDGVSPSTARRDTAVFLIEKVGEHLDPGKTYPPGGPVRLVHCHYKCTVGFDETSPSDYPLPGRKVDRRVEVVYLDKDHLRRMSAPAVATNRR